MIDRLSNFFSMGDKFASFLLKLALLALVSVAIVWMGISVWGNIAISRQEAAQQATLPPSIEKAPYQFIIRPTGEVFYSTAYTMPKTGQYILSGYFSMIDNKWVYNKGNLPLDEKYWGPITVVRR